VSEREELAARGILNVRSINDVKPLPRIFFMAAGALANFLSALVIFILIGLIGVPQPSGARVELRDIAPDSMLGEAGFQASDYIETLNGEKFTTSRDFFQLLAAQSGKEVTITLRRKDVDDPITLKFIPDETEATALARADGVLLVDSIQEASPAFDVGIQPGDVILSFAGQDLVSADDPFAELQNLSQVYEGQTTPIVYQHEDQVVTKNIIPRKNPPSGVGRIGIGLDPQFLETKTGIRYSEGPAQQEYVPLSIGGSITYGLERTGEIMQSIAEFPARLLRRETQPEENRIISIVGVSQIGGTLLQESVQENRPTVLLNYIALISIALGITNLFPIPALDGGRIMFVLLEMVRGKPLSPEREGLIHLIGLAFLLSIGIIFILNDFFNPLTNLLP
jgi:regulator of sigma E protease